MTATRLSFVALLVWLFSLAVMETLTAQVPSGEFADPERQALYEQLIRELRCLVCQNQNLLDSNAELAQDLRRKTHDMVANGQSYEQVVGYMVARYGDFVLYRPPLKPVTFFLWGLPFVFLLLISFFVYRRIRQKSELSSVVLSEEEQAAAEKMLRSNQESS